MIGSRGSRFIALMLGSGLLGCASTSGNPNTADSTNCDNGFLCGTYLDGDGDGSITQEEWNRGYRAADTNGDGALSAAEFTGAGGRR
jgi:EF hand